MTKEEIIVKALRGNEERLQKEGWVNPMDKNFSKRDNKVIIKK